MIGKKSARDYLSGKAFERFLMSRIGKPWNSVYSEICSIADPRSECGRELHSRIKWQVTYDRVVMRDGQPYDIQHDRYPISGFYIHPETKLLQYSERTKNKKPYVEPDQIHWYGDFWFQKSTFETEAKCGCKHFRFPKDEPRIWIYMYRHEPAPVQVCVHGNPPIPREIWYVEERTMHDADEVYQVLHYEEGNERHNSFSGLSKPGDKLVVYWGEKDDSERKYVKTRKQANHKELIALRQLLHK